jgi:hypothetical protein
MKLYLILFYSQGLPYDNGLNLENEKNQFIDTYKNDFDKIIIYTPKLLKEMNYGYFVNEYDNSELLSKKNVCLNNIGCGSWKPIIILLELNKISEDTVLMYHDVNVKKYPQYLQFKNIKKTIENYLNICEFDFIITQDNLLNYQLCKTNVIRELGENHIFSYNINQFIANFMIFKNTHISSEFLNEWLNGCKNEEWINCQKYGDLHINFICHCPEQSIMTLIIANWIRYRKHNIPIDYPRIKLIDRNINNYKYSNIDYLRFLPKKIWNIESVNNNNNNNK